MIRYNFRLPLQGAKTVYANAVLTTDDVSAYRLCFDFSDNGVPYDATDCALVIKAKRADNQVVTDSGVVTEAGDVYYDMKSSVYAVEGELSVEVALCTPQGGYITTHELIFRVRKGHGEATLAAENMTPIISGLMSRALASEQKAEAAQAIGQNALDAAERLDAQGRQDFSNALKGHNAGTLVCINDASPVMHEVGVKLRSKNIFKHSYGSWSTKGITVTVHDDQSITCNGTATEQVYLHIGKIPYDPAYNYFCSGCPAGGGDSYYLAFQLQNNNTNAKTIPDKGEGGIANSGGNYDNFNVVISIASGATVENVTFKPQIEISSVKTNYTPYIDDFSSITVTEGGKNLFAHRFKEGVTETINGITFTGNADGTITVNGTATAYISLELDAFNAPRGRYTLSGFVKGNGGIEDCVLWLFNDHGGVCATEGKAYTYEHPGGNLTPRIGIAEEYTFDNVVWRLQFEKGAQATEFEACKVKQIASSDADGNVYGIMASSSYLTLSTDNPGAVLEVEYNKDISKQNETEFVETIEVTETGIRSIARTQTPGGIPYNFKAMYIRYEVKPSVKNLVLIRFYDVSGKVLCYYQFANTVGSTGFISVHADVIGGMWQAIATSTVSQGSPTGVQMWGRNLIPYGGEKIAKVEVYGYDTSFEVGANIKIYGVR